MQWSSRSKSFDERYPKEKPWHWWFAWYPVTVCERTFWLCWIPRQFVRQIIFLSPSYRAEYSLPEHSIGGNRLGPIDGRKHGPNSRIPA